MARGNTDGSVRISVELDDVAFAKQWKNYVANINKTTAGMERAINNANRKIQNMGQEFDIVGEKIEQFKNKSKVDLLFDMEKYKKQWGDIGAYANQTGETIESKINDINSKINSNLEKQADLNESIRKKKEEIRKIEEEITKRHPGEIGADKQSINYFAQYEKPEYANMQKDLQNMIDKQNELKLSANLYRDNVERIATAYAILKRNQELINEQDSKNAEILKAKNIEEYDRIKLIKEAYNAKNVKGDVDLEQEIYEETTAMQQLQQKIKDVESELKILTAKKIEYEQAGKLGDEGYQQIIGRQRTLTNELKQYNSDLYNSRDSLNDLERQYGKILTEQKEGKKNNKSTNKELAKAKSHTSAIGLHFGKIASNSKKAQNNAGGMANKLSLGLKKLGRYTLMFLGIRGVVTGVAQAINGFMNSENAMAKQLKADLDNLKLNIGNALAPVIRKVLDMFYEMLGVVGAIVKAFFGIDIFAKNTAKSTGETAKNSQDTLASFDKIDVLQSDSGSGGTGTTDITQIAKNYEELANKIKNFLESLFKPFKEAWENEGQKVIDSAKYALNGLKNSAMAVGESFEKIWTNGTVQKGAETLLRIFANMLQTIGNINNAFANAWRKDNNGDKIVQNLANSWNTILGVVESVFNRINKFTISREFQTAMDDMVYLWERATYWADRFTEDLKKIWDEQMADSFTQLLEAGAKTVDVLKKTYDALEPLLKALYDNYFVKFLKMVASLISDIIDAVDSLIDALEYAFEGDFESALESAADAMDSAGKAFEKSMALTSPTSTYVYMSAQEKDEQDSGELGWLSKAEVLKKEDAYNKQTIKNEKKTSKILKGIHDDFNEARLKGSKDTYKELIDQAETGTKQLVSPYQEMKENINNIFSDMKKDLPKTAEEINKNIESPFSKLRESSRTIFEKIKQDASADMATTGRITEVEAEKTNTKTTSIFNSMKNSITSAYAQAKNEANTNMEYLKNNTSNKASQTNTTTSSIFGRLRDSINNSFDSMRNSANYNMTQVKDSTTYNAQQTENKVEPPFTTMKNKLVGVFDIIAGNYRNMWGNISSSSHNPAINNAISAVQSFANSIIKGLNGILAGYRGVRKYITNLPYVGNVANVFLPRLAKGGIATQATPAIIGEAGKEAILPLENNTEWVDTLAQKINANGGGGDVTIKFTGSLSQLARVLKPEIDKENKRKGTTLITGGVA